MLSSANTRIYRPRYTALKRANSHRVVRATRPGFALALPSIGLSLRGRQLIGVLCVVTLLLGLSVTQVLHERIASAQDRVAQVRGLNTVISTENIRLRATRAQLTSKKHIIALAETRLHLFEPEQKQVVVIRM